MKRLLRLCLVFVTSFGMVAVAPSAQAIGTCGHVTVTILGTPHPVPLGSYCASECPLLEQGPNHIGSNSNNVQSFECVYL